MNNDRIVEFGKPDNQHASISYCSEQGYHRYKQSTHTFVSDGGCEYQLNSRCDEKTLSDIFDRKLKNQNIKWTIAPGFCAEWSSAADACAQIKIEPKSITNKQTNNNKQQTITSKAALVGFLRERAFAEAEAETSQYLAQLRIFLSVVWRNLRDE